MKTLLVSNFVFGGQNVYGYCDSKCDFTIIEEEIDSYYNIEKLFNEQYRN